MIICISSFPGTETKVFAKNLSLQLGLKFLDSEGKSLKDKREFFESKKKESFVCSDLAAAFCIPESEKIFLKSEKSVRAKKLAEREGLSFKDALEKVEEMEKKAFKEVLEVFGIEISDLKAYDLCINIDKSSLESAVSLIRKYLEKRA